MATAQQFDVIVIGGGPGGTSSATYLAQRGRRVLLIEKDVFPRFHIGESLLPSCWDQFEELGVTDEMQEAEFMVKKGVQFALFESRAFVIRPSEFPQYFPRGNTLHVDRARFDDILLENARRSGVEIRQPWTVHQVCFDGDRAVGVIAGPNGGEAETIYAPVVIDASGRNCLLARRLGWRRPDPKLNKIAYFTHFEGAYFPDDGGGTALLDVHWVEGGWVWYIPLADGITSVGVVLDAEHLKKSGVKGVQARFDRAIATAPVVSQWVQGARPVMEMQTISNISYLNDSFVGDGFALVGDASMFLDPIFSAGVSIAMRGGILAGRSIHEALDLGDVSAERLRPYEHAIRYPMAKIFQMIYNWYTLLSMEGGSNIFHRAQEIPLLRDRLVVLFSGGYDRYDMDKMLQGMEDWQFSRESGAPSALAAISR